jgi:hypothetical protein
MITSVWPTLREPLKTFLPDDSFSVYVVACRFGFIEEAEAAAKASTPLSYLWRDRGEARNISSTDLSRLDHFIRWREDAGRESIQDFCRWWPLRFYGPCDGGDKHWNDAKMFYSRLAKAIEDAFVRNPSVEFKDLLTVLHKMPDPPVGCKPPPDPIECYPLRVEEFACPLQPTHIRRSLTRIARDLNVIGRVMLERSFEKGVGSN